MNPPRIDSFRAETLHIGGFPSALMLVLALFLAVPPAIGAPRYDTAPHRLASSLPSATRGPADVLKEGMGKLMRFLRAGGTDDPLRLVTFLDREIAPYFDFSYMTRWAAGPRYRRMNAMERKNMRDRLKGMFMAVMVRHLSHYRDAKIRHLSPRKNRAGGVVLGVEVEQGGSRRRLEFHLFPTVGGWNTDGSKASDWTIADVVLGGQSALAYYRRYFSKFRKGHAGSKGISSSSE
uniref:ABC-type transporter Mla maintaining outer membrane lipid asymmetry, MlaC component n=1 Tax=Candidatus Kentrum sp. TC TaxID=2126339 RepID=A0A450Z7Y2_9GAMM|nr:MAG: ABC-type transporter Mla maintaining outer membrane lipid asymmetry, MlaC component [Candidatus Kentron sp. TC]VFK59269.1 MAG: ABC-type transporter Mla maintaining outer membrane lipid asymmetry, MlaC component [Candidatus Kentron sp. TC]